MSGIKDVFVSRYPDGVLIEIDFDQLEIAALAILSKDPQLISDLRDKIDIHRRNAADLFNKPLGLVRGDERKIAKQLSFQLQYGAGAKSMAEKLGLPEKLCERFIDNYYRTYPGVKAWQDSNIRWVKSNRKASSDGLGTSVLPSDTGRCYVFKEENNPYKPGTTSFRPTVIKNYPVQGFATGDIVPHMLGELYMAIKEFNATHGYGREVLLINTIHDSYLLDCPGVIVDDTIRLCHAVLDKTSDTIAEYFGLEEFPIKLGISIKIGDNWGAMKDA